MTWHLTLHSRLEELRRKIEGVRERAAQIHTGQQPAETQELADIEARHADLHHTVTNLRSKPNAPRDEVVDSLEADLEGLAQSVNRWIARQDSKAARP